jgi:hypothetical protein
VGRSIERVKGRNPTDNRLRRFRLPLHFSSFRIYRSTAHPLFSAPDAHPDPFAWAHFTAQVYTGGVTFSRSSRSMSNHLRDAHKLVRQGFNEIHCYLNEIRLFGKLKWRTYNHEGHEEHEKKKANLCVIPL